MSAIRFPVGSRVRLSTSFCRQIQADAGIANRIGTVSRIVTFQRAPTVFKVTWDDEPDREVGALADVLVLSNR